MKKSIFSAALMAVVLFSSCSGDTSENTEATVENHEGMDHSTMDHDQMPTKVVVETPDYTAAGEPVKADIATLVDNYMFVKDALIDENPEAVKTQAQAVLTAAKKIDLSKLEGDQRNFAQEKLDEVKQSATNMINAANVGAQRENLELLSEATFSLTKAFGGSNETLYYQHCPMANNDQGAYWLSSSKEIRNPYFGNKMLKCGSTEEVLNK
jgi:hypothetical protein